MASLRPEVFRARVMELGVADCIPYLDATHIDTLNTVAYGRSENQRRDT